MVTKVACVDCYMQPTFDPDGNQIRLYLEDCGGEVLYYRIEYSIETGLGNEN